MERIKVLVVDDSSIVRDVLASIIEEQEDMEVAGTAPDPFVARDKIVRLNPDVITLDIEMPRMDGLTFLEKIMMYNPLPVIIVSSVTTADPHAAVKALELGAIDVVNKPGGSISIEDVKYEVIQKIRMAYEAKEKFIAKWSGLAQKAKPKVRESKYKNLKTATALSDVSTTDKLIAIGASTGGTVALEELFKELPNNLPPILIVQHMPVFFTYQFADRLNDLSRLTIKEAEQDELVVGGTVYIAPGGKHMEIVRRGANIYTNLHDGERVNFQRPAVDVLFTAVAKVAGKNALGIILTGMGKDGAEGLLAMRQAGAYTVAQDEETSIVWGMPGSAVALGAAQKVAPLYDIPNLIIRYAQHGSI